MTEPTAEQLPRAMLVPRRRISAAWIVPVIAAVCAAGLGYRAYSMRGVVITVQLDRGHGLVPGDDLRYRGISVGKVLDIELTDDAEGVVVKASLTAQSDRLARSGAKFWVVRPKLGLTGVGGLDTLVGPRYLAMLPGKGRPQRHFVGLPEAPTVDSIEPGDLEITLQAAQRGGVRAGAPVLYRQVPIGTIVSVGLASDGGAVEARLHIRKAYIELIRTRTRFWRAGGIDARLGIGGMSIHFDSLETLVAGGVALGTPPDGGDVVHTGHRFRLADKPAPEWLKWEPLVVIGSSYLPPGAPMPVPLRAVMGWEKGRWLKSDEVRRGWVLQTRQGLIGPRDLLTVADEANLDTVVLEVAGGAIPLSGDALWQNEYLALLDAQAVETFWPIARCAELAEPEDCLAVADATATPLPLSAARLTRDDSVWLIDPALAIDEFWHGACVLSRRDGRVVGIIHVFEGDARVVALPPSVVSETE